MSGDGEVVWQKDYFDRAIRNEAHLANCIRYICGNPAKARLREGEFRIWESDFAKSMFLRGKRRGDF